MVPVEKLLDPYAVSLGCHTAAASPAIPGSIIATPWKITILPRCSNNAKVSVSFETTITLLHRCTQTAHSTWATSLAPAYSIQCNRSGIYSPLVTVAGSDSSSETRELAMIVTLPWTLLHSI